MLPHSDGHALTGTYLARIGESAIGRRGRWSTHPVALVAMGVVGVVGNYDLRAEVKLQAETASNQGQY